MSRRWSIISLAALLAPLFVAMVLPVTEAAAQPPVYRYLFDRDHWDGKSFRPATGSLAAGTTGSIEFLGREMDSSRSAVSLDGKSQSITACADISTLQFPATALTVEARVMIFATNEWGGLFGALQDNGSFERGFLLGFRRDRFSFAISTAGKKRLTYLSASQPFETGRWYHVAGVYDGTTMRLYVDGALSAESKEQHGTILHAETGRLEVGAYRDDDEFFRTEGALHSVALFDRALDATELASRAASLPGLPPAPQLKYGPFLEPRSLIARFESSPDSIEITWQASTDVDGEPVAQKSVRFLWDVSESGEGGVELPVQFRHSGRRSERRVIVRDYAPAAEVRYRIIEGDLGSKPYLFDTTFDYRVSTPPEHTSDYTDSASVSAHSYAVRALARCESKRGYAFVLGAVDGALAYHLAMESELQVVVLESDPQRVADIRRRLSATGLYGRRISVHLAPSAIEGALAHYGPHLANLVVSERYCRDETVAVSAGTEFCSPAAIDRLLVPGSGALVLWRPEHDRTSNSTVDWWASATTSGAARVEGDAVVFTRPTLDGAGEWTHQYGHPDNVANSGDDIVGGELRVQWWGRPGPRPMPDRGPRNPAPLSTGGVLYVQGNRVLFGIDAYNGTVLWSKHIPEMRRSNMVRDSGNCAAHGESLYMTLGPDLLQIHGRTGRVTRTLTLPETPSAKAAGAPARSWSYIAVTDDLILGSSTRPQGRYLGDAGEWFETEATADTAKVVSDTFFALDRQSGELRWIQLDSTLVNTSLTVTDDTAYFVEMDTEFPTGGRVAKLPSASRLVALDLVTGEERWRRSTDFTDAYFMLYLMAVDERLVVCTSDKKKTYRISTFATEDGAPGWTVRDKDRKGHHGGHLQHPVVVGSRMFVNRREYDVATGTVKKSGLLERRGCGTMAAGNRMIAYRHYFHGVWDLETDQRHDMLGLRGGCWLGQIPAGGLLLAPESSAGCSCTHSIQISVGYRPQSLGESAASPQPKNVRPR